VIVSEVRFIPTSPTTSSCSGGQAARRRHEVPLHAAFIADCLPVEGIGLSGEGFALLEQAPDVDAIVCGSDQIARGVTDGLIDLGRRVPNEIAVVGFDNWDVMTASSRPPLTSVDMQLYDIGQTAAELLLAAIDDLPVGGSHARPCRLVVRESTAGQRSPALSR
jgi:DNA-binding LacI/PurR family transcriptional regulator